MRSPCGIDVAAANLMQREVGIRTLAGTTTRVSPHDLSILSRSLHGQLVSDEHPDYERIRRVWNGLIDKRPAVIAQCAQAADVIESVRWCAERDLVVSVRGGGHNVAGHAVAEGGFVIDLGLMRNVDVDPAAKIARVAGGATIGDVDVATARFNMAVPLGLVAETGIAGLTLHGGYGWLTRRHGLTVDNLVSAEVVTADAQLLHASENGNSDLFWALRGGGGNFGIVTSFTYRLHPIEPNVWFSAVFYPLSEAAVVLARLRDGLRATPRELGLVATLWSTAPAEPFPEGARGVPVIAVLGCWTGATDEGERQIRWLRELGPAPIADLSGRRSYLEAQRFFEQDYPRGRLYYWKSLYLPELSDAVLEALTAAGRDRASPLSSVDVWFLDGAPADVAENATAFARRKTPFLIAFEANWTDPAEKASNIEWARAGWHRAAQYARGEAYLNFPGFAEEANELVRGAYGDNYPRLRATKRKYDPNNLFRGNFNIPPARRVSVLKPAARLVHAALARARRVWPTMQN